MAAFHLVPYAIGEDIAARFEEDSEVLFRELSKHGKLLEVFPTKVHNPYPIGITLQSFMSMKSASEALYRGIVALVTNWHKDHRLHSGYLNISDRAREVVALVQDRPYSIGSWRPDFLFPRSDVSSFQVCEINARFPFNAFWASHEKNSAHSALGYLEGLPIMPIAELESVPEVFTSVFDSSLSLGILKENGAGWDVYLFVETFNAIAALRHCSTSYQASFSCASARMISPSDLRLTEDGNRLCDGVGELSQFALECSQETLLALEPRVLELLLTSCVYINDIRTILIGHDKRMLAALSDAELMGSYLSPADVALLQKHVVKTYVLGSAPPEVLADARDNRANYLIKPNGEGKGVGIVFGNDENETDESWGSHMSDPAKNSFVLQPLVAQREIEVTCRDGPKKMLVVGVLHAFGSAFLGPGIFRASTPEHRIVNVAGGKGIILAAVVISCRWPLSRIEGAGPGSRTLGLRSESKILDGEVGGGSKFAHLKACELTELRFGVPDHLLFDIKSCAAGEYDQSTLDNILNSLVADGICLIQTDWSADEANDAMVNLISQFGILNCHNDDGAFDVWDVRPIKVSGNGIERSHTAEEFPMHTDCSFEDPPPRYMSLYVVEEDKAGGGLTTLVDTVTLWRYLSRRSLAILHTTEFTIRVPREFFKGSETIRGRILSANKLWRYRSDIIVRDHCTPAQVEALDELDACLANPHLILTTKLPKGALLLLDNSRWFHGRTRIYDQHRWLKRIRFHPQSFHSQSDSAFSSVLQRSKSMGIGIGVGDVQLQNPSSSVIDGATMSSPRWVPTRTVSGKTPLGQTTQIVSYSVSVSAALSPEKGSAAMASDDGGCCASTAEHLSALMEDEFDD